MNIPRLGFAVRWIIVAVVTVAGMWLAGSLVGGSGLAFGQGAPIPFVKAQWLDASGNPLNGGLLYTCVSGLSCTPPTPANPQATYSDAGLTIPNANPVVLDTAGRATVFLSANNYKFVMTDSAGSILWTQDAVRSPAMYLTLAAGTLTTFRVPKASSGNSLINSSISDNGTAVSTTEQMLVGQKVYVGSTVASPTASIEITPGTTGPNSAPIKFGTGSVLMTTPEPMAIETDGNLVYFTTAAGGRTAFTLGAATTTGITGLGASGYIPGFTASTTVGTSVLFQLSNRNVLTGIQAGGSTVTGYANSGGFTVVGTNVFATSGRLAVTSSNSNDSNISMGCMPGLAYCDVTVAADGSGVARPWAIVVGGAERARFQTDGTLSIGTSTDAAFTLDVSGTERISGTLTSGNMVVSTLANPLFLGQSTSGGATIRLVDSTGNASAYLEAIATGALHVAELANQDGYFLQITQEDNFGFGNSNYAGGAGVISLATASVAPSGAGSGIGGQLFIDPADGKLYFSDSAGVHHALY